MARVKEHSEEWAADQGLILTESQMIRNLQSENAELKKYKAFYDHIQNHLSDGHVVICKICGKNIEQVLKENDNG